MRRHKISQRRMAAQILKCGEHRVWFDPDSEKKIKRAMTRADVRYLISEGLIKKIPAKKKAGGKVKRQRKAGSRKGAKGAREGKKTAWLKKVRPQRKLLREIKKELKPTIYRKTYRMVKGGAFRSRKHLLFYLKEKGLKK